MPRAASAEVSEFLERLIRSRHITGGIGLVVLLWLAIGVFETLAEALHAVTGGGPRHSFFRRKLVALVLMGAAGLLLLVALLGSWLVTAYLDVAALLGIDLSRVSFLVHPDFARYVTSALLAVLLTVVYRVAPAQTVSWSAAGGAAFIAAFIWHWTKLAFNMFLLRYSHLSLVFGMLTTFAVLLVWMFYSAFILLFGAIVASVFAGARHPSKIGLDAQLADIGGQDPS